jgi:ribulose-5-phosphate 4-epimerase/fuculose-1-phosphate aldolase
MDDLLELKQRVVAAAGICYRRGMQTGNGGNLSARVPGMEYMIIKASGVSFAECSADTLVVADFDGNLVAGNGKPSRESLLHGALYRKLSRVQAIVHCHSPWATGWASTSRPMPFATYHSEIKLKGEIKVFDTGGYAVPPSFFPEILGLFDSCPDLMAFLLKGHGQVALGRDIKEAIHTAELVEETAQIAVIGRLLEKA